MVPRFRRNVSGSKERRLERGQSLLSDMGRRAKGLRLGRQVATLQEVVKEIWTLGR